MLLHKIMQVSAKVGYGLRAMLELAARSQGDTHMREVWIATRSAMRDVLESVTLAGALTGQFDSPVWDLLARPGAWERR